MKVEEGLSWSGGDSGRRWRSWKFWVELGAEVFAVVCGSYGGSGGEMLGGLRRW